MSKESPRILIVDDEPGIRDAIEVQFELIGWSTDSVGSIDEAWAFLTKNPSDLVVSDVRMPGGSGLELLKKIQADGIQTRVILMSAFTDMTEETVLKLGAVGLLNKPFESSELISLARRVLNISAS